MADEDKRTAANAQAGFLLSQLLARLLVVNGIVSAENMKGAIEVLIGAAGEQLGEDHKDAAATLRKFLAMLDKDASVKPH